MFRKKAKKTYPPGTFIPTPARVFAILQLCIAFSILLWNASLPFMGDLYEVKSKLLIYQHVIEHPQFAILAPSEQMQIAADQNGWQAQLGTPYIIKLGQSFAAILYGIPPLELTWIFFSVILSVLLLKKVQGAAEALWILPLLTVAYACDNQMNRPQLNLSAEQKLFPSEKILISEYLKEPLSRSVFEQQSQLKQAWESYLVAKWTGGSGTADEGFFFFNRERLKFYSKEQPPSPIPRESLFALAFYLFWNFSYAYMASKTTSDKERQLT